MLAAIPGEGTFDERLERVRNTQLRSLVSATAEWIGAVNYRTAWFAVVGLYAAWILGVGDMRRERQFLVAHVGADEFVVLRVLDSSFVAVKLDRVARTVTRSYRMIPVDRAGQLEFEQIGPLKRAPAPPDIPSIVDPAWGK